MGPVRLLIVARGSISCFGFYPTFSQGPDTRILAAISRVENSFRNFSLSSICLLIPKNSSEGNGRLWVYNNSPGKLVFFDYQQGRGMEGPEGILKEYKGYLQVDGYGVYDSIGKAKGITLLYCMAHARRKFVELQAIIKRWRSMRWSKCKSSMPLSASVRI